MLETLTEQDLADLCESEGRKVKEIGLTTLDPGTILIAPTQGGPVMVLEIIDPKIPSVHFSRAFGGRSNLSPGYHGVRRICGPVRCDFRIVFNLAQYSPGQARKNDGMTSVVSEIKVIDPPPPPQPEEPEKDKAEAGAS